MGALFSVVPFLVFFFIVISVFRSAAKVAKKLSEQAPPRMPPANFDPAEAQRTRRIQEEIRKKIAERRGGRALTPGQQARVEEIFVQRTEPVGPPPSEPPALASNAAILERQRQLAVQMRALESARQVEQRKADKITAITDSQNAQTASSAAMRDDLLGGLRDPAMARRAILLREILGTPVGLR